MGSRRACDQLKEMPQIARPEAAPPPPLAAAPVTRRSWASTPPLSFASAQPVLHAPWSWLSISQSGTITPSCAATFADATDVSPKTPAGKHLDEYAPCAHIHASRVKTPGGKASGCNGVGEQRVKLAEEVDLEPLNFLADGDVA